MPTRGTNEAAPRPTPRESLRGGYPVEHFLEVLLLARDRAATESDPYRRKVWAVTIRDIEMILADDPPEILAARDRLAQRADPDTRRLYACACRLLEDYEAADHQAQQAIERAREGRRDRPD